MAERWIGRVALVTGASSGIGEQVARKLVGHGMKVVGCVREDVFHILQAVADDVNSQNGTGLFHPVKCDVTKESEILAMFSEIKDKFGGVDICVNNAGLSIDSPLLSGKTEQWRYMMEVNVMGVAICTREAVKQMMERGVDDGHIVFMNSLLGHTVHVGSTMGFYAGTKHAITALVEGFRQELRLKNSHIRITSISPGKVDTQFYTYMFGKEKAKEMTKLLQYLKPEDIANSIIHALHAPAHCQVQEIRIRPVEQS